LPGSMDDSTYLYCFVLSYIEDEVSINNQYPVSELLEPFILWNNPKGRIRCQLRDSRVESIKLCLCGRGIVSLYIIKNP